MAEQSHEAVPARTVSGAYLVMLAVAMVVGAGIFKSPALVAQNAGSADWMFLAWSAGGVISLLGAFCYAELSSAFPNAGGDYHFLKLAYGRPAAFLFAWARFAIINTGSIAILGFVFGDYLNVALPIGLHGSVIYAFASVAGLVALNLRPRHSGEAGDFVLTGLEVAGVLLLAAAAGFLVVQGAQPLSESRMHAPFDAGGFGYALVFAMLAYGGWNEIATMSAEAKDGRFGVARALVVSVLIITALYMLCAWSLLRGLGLEALAKSEAPAAELAGAAFGPAAKWISALAIACATFTSINATIIVGGRTTYAAAHDFPTLRVFGVWDEKRGIPARAYLVQGVVALALVGVGDFYEGFATLVDYTAPVFWLFMAMSGAAVIVLRLRRPDAPRPFRTPLYPMPAIVFALAGAGMTWSAIAYVKAGAMFGVGVLAMGVVVYLLLARRS
jgi:amino acid transporter